MILVLLAPDLRSLSAFASTTESRESVAEKRLRSDSMVMWCDAPISHQSCLTECLHLKNSLHTFYSTSLAVAMFLRIFFFTAVVFIGVCYPNTFFSWKRKWVTVTGTQFRSLKDTSASCDYRSSNVICVLKTFGVIWKFLFELITVLSNRSVLKT